MKGSADLVLSLIILITLFIQAGLGLKARNLTQIGEYHFDFPDVSWGLTDQNKTKTCILLSGYFEIVIPYDTDYGTKALAIIPVPQNASVNGVCDGPDNKNMQVMTLTWQPSDMVGVNHILTFVFTRRGFNDELNALSEPYYELKSIEAKIQTNDYDFPDAFLEDKVYNLTASNLGIMSAPQSLSYFCKAAQLVEFDNGEDSLGMSNVHAEAFHTSIAVGDGRDYGPKSFCAKDGIEVILMVVTYVVILGLIGLGIFYIVDRRSKNSYIYL